MAGQVFERREVCTAIQLTDTNIDEVILFIENRSFFGADKDCFMSSNMLSFGSVDGDQLMALVDDWVIFYSDGYAEVMSEERFVLHFKEAFVNPKNVCSQPSDVS